MSKALYLFSQEPDALFWNPSTPNIYLDFREVSWLMYANQKPWVLLWGPDLSLINHFGLTSWPERQR